MKIKFDVSAQELKIIRQILQDNLPERSKVWVFGSRAKHQAKFNSDLDLAIESEQPLERRTLMQLELAFDEAPLPYSVDIVDMQKVDTKFQQIIERQKVLFPVKNNVPELRFPEFSDSWIAKKGDDIFINSRLKGEAGLPIYSVTMNDGLVPRNSLDRKMEDDAADELNLRAMPGDLVYNMMRMWQGAVGLAEVECMLSPAYVVLSPKPGIDTRFFLYNLKRSRALYDLWSHSHGLTDDRLRLYFKDFGKIIFIFSEYKEQLKIASFIALIDKKLNSLRRKKNLIEVYKRGLMQKIFSKKIRFKKESDVDFSNWRNIRADKVFKNHSNKNHSGELPILAVTQENGVVRRDSVDIDIKSSDKSIKSYKIIEPGNFVISLRSFQGGLEYSRIYGISSPAYTVLKPILEICDDFYRYYFKQEGFIKKLASTVIGIRDGKQISYSAFTTLNLPYPSVEEQRRIVASLSAFDRKIAAISNQIEQLEKFKKGLLQKMFV